MGRRLGFAAACGVAAVLTTHEVIAASFAVTKTEDTADGVCDADCSLREAVQASNLRPGFDEIVLAPLDYALSLRGTGIEHGGDLEATGDLLIRPSSGRAQVDGGGWTRILHVHRGASVELRNLVLTGGFARGRGGAIFNAGALTLSHVTVGSARLIEDRNGVIEGGALYNAGSAWLVATRLHDNVAMGGPSLLAGGRGGAIYNAPSGQLRVRTSRIDSNSVGLDDANGYGGGLYNAGAATIERCFFGNNDPGGGEGSAIANRGGARLSVSNSTFSGNGHDGATGAIANGTRQQAPDAPSDLTLTHVTIADNNGGGLYNSGTARLRNVIIGGNYVADVNDRDYGYPKNCITETTATLSQVHALLASNGNCPAWRSADNETFLTVELWPLVDRGGIDATHVPRTGGQAIDAAAAKACPAIDQVGHARPLDGDGDGVAACDLGALEAPAAARP